MKICVMGQFWSLETVLSCRLIVYDYFQDCRRRYSVSSFHPFNDVINFLPFCQATFPFSDFLNIHFNASVSVKNSDLQAEL